ncbi:MAG TPA: hypothetical protein VIT93_04140 [Dehalococcoidia bacterium]
MGFFIFIGIAVGLFVGFLGIRRLTAPRHPSAVEAGCVVATGTNAEVQLAKQTLKVAGIFSRVRNVDRTAFAMPTEFELWVKEKDADRARDALGLDADL